MTNQPEDNLEKFISQELIKQDAPIEFISDVKEFWLDTLFWYEAEDSELEELYIEYQTEIELLVQNHSDEIEKILSYSQDPTHSKVWRATEQTLLNIETIISEE